MATISTRRASHQNINPNIRVGRHVKEKVATANQARLMREAAGHISEGVNSTRKTQLAACLGDAIVKLRRALSTIETD